MLRRLASSLLLLAERLFEKGLDQAQVETYLQSGVQQLLSACRAEEAGQAAWYRDGIRVLRHTIELGLLSSAPEDLVLDAPSPEYEREQGQAWRERLEEGDLIRRDGVRAGTMTALNSLLRDPANDSVLQPVIESLLRHVELRRERALQLSPGGSEDEMWIEKHGAAILLARAAQRFHDPRYLNAALKLNDRAWRFHRRVRLDRRHVLYLYALSEAELGLRRVVV
ncbi:MAG: hypothetical protein P8X64_02140 [Anaerolineales bacterium]|jgi:hypothetical protein